MPQHKNGVAFWENQYFGLHGQSIIMYQDVEISQHNQVVMALLTGSLASMDEPKANFVII